MSALTPPVSPLPLGPLPMAPAAPALPAAPAAPAWGGDAYFGLNPAVPPAPVAPVAPAAPGMLAPAAPAAPAAPGYGQVVPQAAPQLFPQATYPQAAPAPGLAPQYSAQGLSQGPILPTSGAAIAGMAARAIPAGTAAAVGAATAIAGNTNATMGKAVAKIVTEAGEPLLKLSWGLLSNTFEVVGSLITFNFPKAFSAVGKLFKETAFDTAGLFKKITQPFSLTAATSGGARLGLGQAVGAGLSAGMKALKSSFVWAIPAAGINAFIDYKYKDQTDVKRLGANFAADVVGYTATGMAGAAVGAMVGSMTVPLVGTLVGAGVGILLGLLHDKTTRPMISDAIRDSLG